jgi:hypothetical protein
MLTAMLAVRNIFGEKHDLWAVNTERSYHEEFTVQKPAPSQLVETPVLHPSICVLPSEPSSTPIPKFLSQDASETMPVMSPSHRSEQLHQR